MARRPRCCVSSWCYFVLWASLDKCLPHGQVEVWMQKALKEIGLLRDQLENAGVQARSVMPKHSSSIEEKFSVLCGITDCGCGT
jgi:hypothetical protein